MNSISPKKYSNMLQEVKARIRSAQYKALRAVNLELISLYWDLGKIIVGRLQGETWGKSVVERLSEDLRRDFPGTGGFSASNLWRIKQFFESYRGKEKLARLVREIGWSQNLVILAKCKGDQEKEFYLKMTRKMGWTKDVLVGHIDNKTFEKTLLNQTNFDTSVSEEIRHQAKLAVKDEYSFGFLELGEAYSERQLEKAMLGKIEEFLREMGGVFSFLGSQYRLEVDEEEYFIDLLLYHRGLSSLVAIELKTGKFLPEYIGKMQFYLAVLDDKVKLPKENPSIGIILCRDKKKTIVEYALKESNRPIGVCKYKTVTRLPDKYRGSLPEPEQVAKLLDGIEAEKSIPNAFQKFKALKKGAN